MCKPVLPYANNNGADQPAHSRSRISAYVIRCLDSIIPLISISEISRLASPCSWADRLSLIWSQIPDRFSHDEAQRARTKYMHVSGFPILPRFLLWLYKHFIVKTEQYIWEKMKCDAVLEEGTYMYKKLEWTNILSWPTVPNFFRAEMETLIYFFIFTLANNFLR